MGLQKVGMKNLALKIREIGGFAKYGGRGLTVPHDNWQHITTTMRHHDNASLWQHVTMTTHLNHDIDNVRHHDKAPPWL